jgi:hypothetical protein
LGHYTILPFEFTYDYDDVPFPSVATGPDGCEHTVRCLAPRIAERLPEGGRLDFLFLEPHPDPDDESTLRGAAGFFLPEPLDSESLFRLQTHVVMPFISYVDEEAAVRGMDLCRVTFGTDFATPVRGEEEWVWNGFLKALENDMKEAEAEWARRVADGSWARQSRPNDDNAVFHSSGYSLLVARLLREATYPNRT